MKDTDDVAEREAGRSLALRMCQQKSGTSSCLGRDWYHTCLDCIADLEQHAARHKDLHTALAPWCELCAAVGDALNEDRTTMGAQEHGDYVNASPIARWLLRRLDRRFW